MRKVIGEGGYGCVIKPSLKCNDDPKNIPYDHYISKLMKTDSAKKEFSEFLIISKLDKKNVYHLGTPTICVPDIKEADVIHDIEKCKKFKTDDIMLHPQDYRILVLEDGGYDLSIFCKKHLKSFVQNKTNCQLFWLNVHRLFKGLVFFKKHNIIHYDLKPQNIVFDEKTKQFKFIDFGLMKRASSVLEKSKKNENKSGLFHWSYPIDNGFLNESVFNTYRDLSNKKKSQFRRKFTKEIFNKSNNDGENNLIKHPESFKLLFYYIYLNPDVKCVERELKQFFATYTDYISEHSYLSTIEKTVKSIDIYGLGFTLKFVLNKFYKLKSISEKFYRAASELFETMYSFNFPSRSDSAEELLKKYEQILLENEFVSSLNKTIEIKRESITLSPQLEKSAYDDPQETDINSKSILKKIKGIHQIEENPHSRSRSNQTQRLHSSTTNKNAKTQKLNKRLNEQKNFKFFRNRRIQKCTTGKVRNSKFKCVSQKKKNK